MKLNRIIVSLLLICIWVFIFPRVSYATDFDYGSMGGYYTLSEVYAQLDNMYAKYPNLITEKESIGTTVEGRPIYAVKISDNPTVDESEPEVFYNSLIHSTEPMGMEVTIYFMYYLLENYNTDSIAKYLVDNREMYFIPAINPDGYYYNETTNPTGGGTWRKNRRDNGDGTYGVDLNRNFGPESLWDYPNGSSSTVTSNSSYRGPTFFSEPETQAFRDFLSLHNFKTSLHFHSYGGDILYPYAMDGSVYATDDSIFKEWAEDMVNQNNYVTGNVLHAISYNARGSTIDYMYDGDIANNHGKIFTLSPEIGITDFWPPQANIPIETAALLWPCKYISFVAGGYVNFISSTLSSSYINPGGNLNLSINLKNKGLATSEEVVATLTTTSPYITITNGAKTVGQIESQQNLTVNNAFSFSVSEDAPLGQQLDFTLTISVGEVQIETSTLTMYVATAKTIFSDECDNLNNWSTVSNQSTVWEITTENYHSSPTSCTDSKDSNYTYFTKYLDNGLITKTIDLTDYSSPKLSYWTKFDINPKYDYARVQVSKDDGSTWTNLDGVYFRDYTLYNHVAGPLYTNLLNNWKREEIDLSSYAGYQIKIKFLLTTRLRYNGYNVEQHASIQNYTRDGWYLDDVKVFQYDKTLSDIIKPNKNWTDNFGTAIEFKGSGGDNIYTTESLPSFTFTKSSDTTSGISSYEIFIKPVGKDYYSYITGIADKSSGTEINNNDRYTRYDGNEITVYSKKEEDRLKDGAYKWIVKAFDGNGNSIDSDAKILRINMLSANFSGEWFPLVLLSKKVTNQTPSFTGISTVGSKVTVNIVKDNITVATGQATVDSTSRFNIVFSNKLPVGIYKVNISAINKNNDFVAMPEFRLNVFVPVKTDYPSTLGVSATQAPEMKPTMQPESIQITAKRKHCFLWWCW